MKKTVFAITFSVVALWATAQVNVGFRAGMNAGLFDLKTDGIEKYDITPRLNLILGFEVDAPFSTVFSFRTGLSMVQKASEIDRTPEMAHPDTIWSTLYRMNYLELPLFIVGRAETDIGNFYLGVGPTFSLGLGGQVNIAAKSVRTNKQKEYNQKLVWDGKEGPTIEHNFYHFRRFDMGVGAFLAYQLPNGFTFTINYNKGLRDISPVSKTKFTTSYIGLSVGFLMRDM